MALAAVQPAGLEHIPSGDQPHHYIFTVHALKVAKLDLDAMVGYMLNAKSLGKSSLTATYASPATD